jgi:hypothetical protein
LARAASRGCGARPPEADRVPVEAEMTRALATRPELPEVGQSQK